MKSPFTWMTDSALARVILETSWAFPAMETLHFLGLTLLIGSIYVVDLRLLGFGRRISLEAAMQFIPIAGIGFAINVVTGIGFLLTDPVYYYSNLSFRLKMLLVLFAGLNALWFKHAVHVDPGESDWEPRATAKASAALSILLWTGVIVLGRLIPYLK